ncbi:MAG: UDP-N-acetylmuramate dehydrogenase [Oscillospiraceae bacterium]
MNDFSLLKAFLDKNKIDYSENTVLKEYTTFKIGGCTPFLINVKNENEITILVKFLSNNNINFFVLGKGSNLLISDDGIEYPVIKLSNDFSKIIVRNTEIIAFSGASLSTFCKTACENGLSGAEFAFGIPGTVGGAIYMNAGAYDGEISNIIISVKALDKKGNIKEFSKEELNLSYRKSVFQKDEFIILSAKFKFEKSTIENIKTKMDNFLNKRKEKQPLEFPSAGSTFKRPEGTFAGSLIEKCQLKGYSVGGAMISEKHAGFIINYNNATALDVVNLIESVQKEVKNKTGFFLEPEVKLIGNF